MTISRTKNSGVTNITYDDVAGTLNIGPSTDPAFANDYLFESSNPKSLIINFDGGSQYDAIILAGEATKRTISGQLDQSIGGRAVRWTVQSAFATGMSTIKAQNIEWVKGPDGQWYNLELAGFYLRANRISSSVNFVLGDSNTRGTYTLNTTDSSVASYGAANNIVYALSRANSVISTGDGNDLVATYFKSVIVDGGNGIDTYVMPDNYDWKFENLPPASGATYRYDQTSQALCVSVTFNNDTDWMNVYLKNFERIVYGDKTVRLQIGNAENNMIRPSDEPFAVMMGLGGNDTIYGYGFGDTLSGGEGDDCIIGGKANVTFASNLIVNGSFENGSAGWTSQIRYYPSSGQNYWGPGGTIKLWNSSPGDKSVTGASDGSSFVQIDHDWAVNGLQQSIKTVKGKVYTVSFDMAAQINNIRDVLTIEWNGQVIGSYWANRNQWKTYTTTVVGTGGLDSLAFYERPAENNGRGILLDNVKLGITKDVTVFDGGAGVDTMLGTTGIDRFVFNPGDTGATEATADLIRWFTSGQDLVDVKAIADGRPIIWSQNQFSGQADKLDILTQKTATGMLALLDVNGDKTADYAIRFDGISSLQKRDFGI